MWLCVTIEKFVLNVLGAKTETPERFMHLCFAFTAPPPPPSTQVSFRSSGLLSVGRAASQSTTRPRQSWNELLIFNWRKLQSCFLIKRDLGTRTLRPLDSLSSAVINSLPQRLGLIFRFIASFSFDSHHQTFPLDGIHTTQEGYQCGWVSKKNKWISRLCVECSSVFVVFVCRGIPQIKILKFSWVHFFALLIYCMSHFG